MFVLQHVGNAIVYESFRFELGHLQIMLSSSDLLLFLFSEERKRSLFVRQLQPSVYSCLAATWSATIYHPFANVASTNLDLLEAEELFTLPFVELGIDVFNRFLKSARATAFRRA